MALSPMMQQYLETKNEYKDCILLYRLGDFYEMFFEDAILVSRELELTLTARDCGLEEKAPMCGVPYHALDNYLYRLVQKGYKAAIAEQIGDPKSTKGVMKREVIRVVTPGTITSESALSQDKNNFLMCIAYLSDKYGICACDVSTGDFYVSETDSIKNLYDEINKYAPVELIANVALEMSGLDFDFLKSSYSLSVDFLDNMYFSQTSGEELLKEHFKVATIEALGLADFEDAAIAAAATLRYLYDTQKSSCSQISFLKLYHIGEYMLIDAGSRRNLELLETMREKKKKGSLLWILDHTKTAMGARLLRKYIEQPLIEKAAIIARQDAIEELQSRYMDREELRRYLDKIYDLERLMAKVSNSSANPRDLLSLKNSIAVLPALKEIIKTFDKKLFRDLCESLDSLDDIYDIIFSAIDEEAPIAIKEGAILKSGYDEQVDKLRAASTEGKSWLAELEAREREKSGIKGLKIKYNKIFGYYFEVTNSYKELVPDYFIRKQTLANAERYTIDELKDLEELILGAEDKLNILEYELYLDIRQQIGAQIKRIQRSAKIVAELDVLVSLALTAYENAYIRPRINEKGIINIKEARHPVVEKIVGENNFISNDVYLDSAAQRMNIITGPNMAGKSTYMRQVALIVLMAQMGSFVPAKEAEICICDRIFTRVGASDDLASGKSTFMVEMTEVANILRNATKKSLIILDEIGRGTSTFDGLSIAWAVVEHIANTRILGAKTLFATHYHELTELEGRIAGLSNYCVAVKEHGDSIVFLRKIVKGGADKSYGIQVAKLAGVPEAVISRAKEIVEELAQMDITQNTSRIMGQNKKSKPVPRQGLMEAKQLSLFEAVKDDDIISELGALDISVMTPIDALNTLYKLQNKIKNRI